MSHKTLISGTAYEVVGGAQMIDGTKFQMGGVKRLSAERRSPSRFPAVSQSARSRSAAS